MKIKRTGWMGDWEEDVPEAIRAEVLGDDATPNPELDSYLLDPEFVRRERIEKSRREYRPVGRARGSTKMQMLWDRVIVALLRHTDPADAAEDVGVPVKVIRECINNPLFLEQLDAAQRQRVAHANLVIQGQMGTMVENLLRIANDEKKSDTSRLTAIKMWLDKAQVLQEQQRAEEAAMARVERLEKVKHEIILGRLGGEDLALPEVSEGGEGDGDAERGPADDPVAEDDGAAGDGPGEAGGGAAEAGESGADE